MFPIGVYTCKLDDKGRMLIPAPIKKVFEGVLDDGFVLKQSVYNPCLEFYPMKDWADLMEKLSKLDPFQQETDIFIRTFVAGHRMVELDKPGRILITKDLQQYAGLQKEVIFASQVNKIEIWDKAKYQESVSAPVKDFGALAQRVMSKVNNQE